LTGEGKRSRRRSRQKVAVVARRRGRPRRRRRRHRERRGRDCLSRDGVGCFARLGRLLLLLLLLRKVGLRAGSDGGVKVVCWDLRREEQRERRVRLVETTVLREESTHHSTKSRRVLIDNSTSSLHLHHQVLQLQLPSIRDPDFASICSNRQLIQTVPRVPDVRERPSRCSL